MNTTNLNFDLLALAEPKGRLACKNLALEILQELDNISAHIDRAFAQCEAEAELTA